jgi:hypothetical protein
MGFCIEIRWIVNDGPLVRDCCPLATDLSGLFTVIVVVHQSAVDIGDSEGAIGSNLFGRLSSIDLSPAT